MSSAPASPSTPRGTPTSRAAPSRSISRSRQTPPSQSSAATRIRSSLSSRPHGHGRSPTPPIWEAAARSGPTTLPSTPAATPTSLARRGPPTFRPRQERSSLTFGGGFYDIVRGEGRSGRRCDSSTPVTSAAAMPRLSPGNRGGRGRQCLCHRVHRLSRLSVPRPGRSSRRYGGERDAFVAKIGDAGPAGLRLSARSPAEARLQLGNRIGTFAFGRAAENSR